MKRSRFVVLAILCSILAGCAAPSKTATAAPEASAGNPPAANPIAVVDTFDVGGWQTCGTCGNTGGSGNPATANYSVTGATTPSLDGQSSKFAIAALAPYANAYWWYVNNADYAASKHVAYEFQLYIPASAREASQAVEFEFQQSSGGMTYNFAWQADFSHGVWRNFDFGQKKWVATSVTLSSLTPDTWHKIRIEGTRTDTVLTNNSITIDGVVNTVNSQFTAPNTGANDKFTNAFQLDSDSAMNPYSVYVDAMKVEIY
jgi:hypothetical protein